jgi:DNA (cytosine-5)-methyltransferase 1
LIKSPSKQRGRDFGVMLACLNKMGYTAEWRVINAADYGFPQKRRRTFIFATRAKKVAKRLYESASDEDVILSHGFFAPIFNVSIDEGSAHDTELYEDLQQVSDSFRFDFRNAGYMDHGGIFTIKTLPKYSGRKMTLRDVLVADVDEQHYVDERFIGNEKDPIDVYRKSWKYCKGAKAEHRKDVNGYEYNYTEGPIPFPDRLDEPSRTMLTSDGNKRPNRITHIILDPRTDRYRVLTPVEAERLNGFEDDWTEGMSSRWRYFCMGNALVVGLIEIMGKRLKEVAGIGPSGVKIRTLSQFD